ncbi:pollen-specific leucine-rich repeat extensin-like protein 3 [Iris pallida]|uniref:Pollen-specific leucine-rich repeat extensin-like protein 3 n=1 Tax=Iris pallida TaxID=29817 RepID=A0AAX6GNR7_IRIPA|nr:pollen-specific leucine-rich repeat extensin-like protein 3 [Iris pallida]
MTCALFRRNDYFGLVTCSRLLNSFLVYFFHIYFGC